MLQDLSIFENGNGGELNISSSDLSLSNSLLQQAYLCLFGGNYEASTTGNEINGQQKFDWWGNNLLFFNSPDSQFNSNTERVLSDVVLNTAGRIDIKRAVDLDLQPLLKLANVESQVLISSANRVEILITVEDPETQQDKILRFAWDNIAKTIIIDKEI